MKNNMKKISVLIMACSMGVVAQAQLIDDFSGGLTAYTLSKVLDNNTVSQISFSDPSGALQATYAATGTAAAEQVLFLRSDYSLGIGYVLRADVNYTLAGSQDLGIALATTATPFALGDGFGGDVRTNYILAAIRSSANHVIGTGIDGANGHTGFAIDPQQQSGGTNFFGLYIARTSATTFDIGYNYNSSYGYGDIFLRTLTVTDSTIGNAVGFYADMRTAGTIGTLDNLRIELIPEPTTMTLCGLGGFLGLVAWMRRKK
jgi:hypothetical protein